MRPSRLSAAFTRLVIGSAAVLVLILVTVPFRIAPAQVEPSEGTTAAPVSGSTATAQPGLPEGVIGLGRIFDEADSVSQSIDSALSNVRTPLPAPMPTAQAGESVSASRARVLRLAGLGLLGAKDLDQESQQFTAMAADVDQLSRDMGDRILAIQKAQAQISDIAKTWRDTRAVYVAAGISGPPLDKIDTVLQKADKASAELDALVPPLLDAQNALSESRGLIRDHLDFLAQRKDWISRSTWERDSASLFSSGFGSLYKPKRAGAPGVGEIWADYVAEAAQYLSSKSLLLALELGLVLLSWLWLRGALQRVKELASKIPRAGELNVLISRPFSIAVLLACLPAPLVFTAPPPLIRDGYLLILMVPTLFLLTGLTAEKGLQRFIIAMGVCYAAGLAQDIFMVAPPLDRLFLIGQAGLGLAAALLLLHPGWLSKEAQEKGWAGYLPWIRLARWLLTLLLTLVLAGEVAGYTRAGQFISRAAFGSVYLALLILATYRLLRSLIVYFAYSPPGNRMRLFSSRADETISVLERFLERAAIVVWLVIAAAAWNITDDLLAAAGRIWRLGLNVGETRVTAGMAVSSILALYLAVKISRLVRFLLEEELYPRRETPLGLRDAVNQGLHYLFLFAGFVAALSFIGIKLESLALVAGALGVGIGFGLQNVVNNFVAGLILLVERPIKIGDVVERETFFGVVRHIGIRATVIETWEQSEIIVPNGDLLWSQLKNWTHTHAVNRVSIKAGVAYGSDPEKVMSIIKKTALAHPEVLTTPEPMVLFTGFGDSSLDFELRIWLPSIDGRIRIPSEIRVAMYQAFNEEGIEIPFPQRDIHLKTVPAKKGEGK